jgi:rfaE bifunctional protein nucleotidyltransferase chain/domain
MKGKHSYGMTSKVMSLEEAALIAEGLRNEGKSVVTANGSFDIIHPGHIRFLVEASMYGDVLMVSVNCDAYIERTKKRKPFMNHHDRMRIIAALGCVDCVVLQESDSASEILESIKPRVHYMSSEYKGCAPEVETAAKTGTLIIFAERTGRYSSTDIAMSIATNVAKSMYETCRN